MVISHECSYVGLDCVMEAHIGDYNHVMMVIITIVQLVMLHVWRRALDCVLSPLEAKSPAAVSILRMTCVLIDAVMDLFQRALISAVVSCGRDNWSEMEAAGGYNDYNHNNKLLTVQHMAYNFQCEKE